MSDIDTAAEVLADALLESAQLYTNDTIKKDDDK